MVALILGTIENQEAMPGTSLTETKIKSDCWTQVYIIYAIFNVCILHDFCDLELI